MSIFSSKWVLNVFFMRLFSPGAEKLFVPGLTSADDSGIIHSTHKKSDDGKSSPAGDIQRERQRVEAAYGEDGRKPFLSRSAETEGKGKRCRMPALKDRICWNLK